MVLLDRAWQGATGCAGGVALQLTMNEIQVPNKMKTANCFAKAKPCTVLPLGAWLVHLAVLYGLLSIPLTCLFPPSSGAASKGVTMVYFSDALPAMPLLRKISRKA